MEQNFEVASMQTLQLSLDYLSQDSKVMEEVSRFHGIHIESLENFEAQIKTYKAEESLQTGRQIAHDKLHTWTRETAEGPYRKPNEVVEAGLRAAGVMVMNKRNDLKAEHDKLNESGSDISGAIVEYFAKRLPDLGHILLFGKRYELEHKVLTINKGKHILTFGSGEVLSAIARKVYVGKDNETLRVAQSPSVQDWETLIANLNVAASF